MPPAVDDESGGAHHVHQLVGQRLTGESSGGQQQVSEQDQSRACPTRHFNQKAQQACLVGQVDFSRAAIPSCSGRGTFGRKSVVPGNRPKEGITWKCTWKTVWELVAPLFSTS